MLLYVHRNRTDYYGRGVQDRHLDFLLVSESSMFFQVQCCFTPTQSVRTIRDGDPTTATSTFTQVLSSECLKDRGRVKVRTS